MANKGTLTGSIGVIAEFLQLQDALNKLGIQFKTIKSGKLKDSGSSTRKMTEVDERYFQDLMDDVHRQFMYVVEEERSISHEEAVALADGRVFTGEQAVDNGLVDTLGTYEEAILIAAELGGIEGQPAIVREQKRQSFFDRVFGDVAESISDLALEMKERPVLSFRFTGPL